MSNPAHNNFEIIKSNLVAAQKAYKRFSEIIIHPSVIADKQKEKPKGAHLLEIVEKAYHSHLPAEILQIILQISLPGASGFKTRSTNLWAGNKHYEGLDVEPALNSINENPIEWQTALITYQLNENLDKLIRNIIYYRDQMERVLGEAIVFYRIADV